MADETGWLRPISYIDLEDRWENEDAILDESEETFATCRNVCPRCIAPALRFDFARPTGRTFKFLYGNSLEPGVKHWYQGEDGNYGYTIMFVSPINAFAEWADMYFYALYREPACAGPLAPICKIFHDIGDFFSGLADTISGVFIVGDYLASPFRSLGGTFHDLGDTCCQASATLQEILDLLEGGITWDEISAMILGHWPNLAPLITDPLGYITDIISDLIPDIPDWLSDPLSWLIDTLKEHFPSLYYLVVDPAGQMLYLLAQLFDLTPYEARTPEFLVKALFERYFPDLYRFWRVGLEFTWDWLLDKLEKTFKSVAKRLYRVAENVLLYFFEGIQEQMPKMIEVWFRGTITEAKSPALAGAVVSVVGTDLSTVADAAGQYELRGMAPEADSYSLRVSKAGYRDTLIAGVVAKPGVLVMLDAVLEFIVTPPEANPAPRLQRLIDVYYSVAEKAVQTQEILDTKRGTPSEEMWQAQLDELLAWLSEACNDIQVAQAELQLYFSVSGVPAEYAYLLEFRC